MNRKLLALAIGAALALPVVAQAAPTVYGQLNLSVDKVDLESEDVDPATAGIQPADHIEINSNKSRIGVMGEESLGGSLSAVYKAEWEVAGDVAGAGDLSGRDRYLGLKGGFGTVKLGAYDSPLKTSQGTVDQFNDLVYMDIETYISGENRMDNLLGYESPMFMDALSVKLAVQAGETNANDSFEAFSAAVAYDTDTVHLAVAMDSDAADGPYSPAAGRDSIRVSGTVKLGSLDLGALVQTSETSDEVLGGKDDEEAVLISAALNMGKNVLKGQFAMVNHDFGGPDEQESMVAEVGFDHNFTQMTRAYAALGLAQTDNVGGAAGADADDTVFKVGMLTRF